MRRPVELLSGLCLGLGLGWLAPRPAAPQAIDPVAYYASQYVRHPASFRSAYEYAYTLHQTVQDSAAGAGAVAARDLPAWDTLCELLPRCETLAQTETERNLCRVLRDATSILEDRADAAP